MWSCGAPLTRCSLKLTWLRNGGDPRSAGQLVRYVRQKALRMGLTGSPTGLTGWCRCCSTTMRKLCDIEISWRARWNDSSTFHPLGWLLFQAFRSVPNEQIDFPPSTSSALSPETVSLSPLFFLSGFQRLPRGHSAFQRSSPSKSFCPISGPRLAPGGSEATPWVSCVGRTSQVALDLESSRYESKQTLKPVETKTDCEPWQNSIRFT